MVNMFTAQPAQAQQPTGATPATGTAPTGKPTGFFSAGNAFGQMAGQAYQNTQQYLQNNPLDYSSAPALPGVNDFSADRQRIEQALMGRARGELDTRYNQETADFEQQMANQGIDIGSERYKRERALFDKGRNEAYNDANFRAMLAGGDEQKRLFDLGLAARKQSVEEQDTIRASRIADLAALLSPAEKQEKLIADREIAAENNATTRYGIDSVSNTANRDRTSRDQNARRSDATERFGIRTGSQTSNKDRRSREKENEKDRRFRGSEGDKDRKNARILNSSGNVGFTPEDDKMNKPPGTGAQ